MTKTDLPDIMVEKRGGKLSPLTSLDEEWLDDVPNGTVFALKAEPRRSLPLHNTYWKMLTRIVKATNVRPTPLALHEVLLFNLGFVHVEPDYDLKNPKPRLVRDSTAFNNMKTDAEFKPYFDMAVAFLSEALDIDPLDFLREEQ